MMITLTSIDRKETLRYLACKNDNIDESTMAIMDKCEKELLDVIAPKFIYRYFDIDSSEDTIKLSGSSLIMEGNDIKAHLSGCSGAVLIAATLGPAIYLLELVVEIPAISVNAISISSIKFS